MLAIHRFIQKIIFRINAKRTRPIKLYIDNNGNFYTNPSDEVIFKIAEHHDYNPSKVIILMRYTQQDNGTWFNLGLPYIFENEKELLKEIIGMKLVK